MKYPSHWIISKMKMSLKWEIFSMCGLRHRIFKKFTHPCQWKTPQMPKFSKILQQHWNHHHHIFCAIFWSQYIQQKKMSPCPVFYLDFLGVGADRWWFSAKLSSWFLNSESVPNFDPDPGVPIDGGCLRGGEQTNSDQFTATLHVFQRLQGSLVRVLQSS